MGELASLTRTLEQELFALLRGASLECLVCGEFVLHVKAAVVCPQCRSLVFREAVVDAETVLAQVEALATG